MPPLDGLQCSQWTLPTEPQVHEHYLALADSEVNTASPLLLVY